MSLCRVASAVGDVVVGSRLTLEEPCRVEIVRALPPLGVTVGSQDVEHHPGPPWKTRTRRLMPPTKPPRQERSEGVPTPDLELEGPKGVRITGSEWLTPRRVMGQGVCRVGAEVGDRHGGPHDVQELGAG